MAEKIPFDKILIAMKLYREKRKSGTKTIEIENDDEFDNPYSSKHQKFCSWILNGEIKNKLFTEAEGYIGIKVYGGENRKGVLDHIENAKNKVKDKIHDTSITKRFVRDKIDLLAYGIFESFEDIFYE